MSLGIPYMGSKRKLASAILKAITSRHKGITDFYDLFGGGGAVSFTAIKNYRFNVHYNELNSHIYELVKYLKTNRTLEPKFYEWVTREEFFKQINRTDADWYSGFVMTCWSFGNNSEKGYLYGQDIMETKRLAHEFIVNGDLEAMKELGVNIPELLDIKDVQKRRVVFCDYIKKNICKLVDNRVQNLELVEHLTRLQNLQNLQNLQINNKDYKDIKITGANPIIYCDIPYKGTGEYKEGNFNHEEFYDWANEIEYPVYISEYDAPFEMVQMFSHRSSLSATNNAKKTIESIFWNRKGNIQKTTIFDE
jgi:site-specific DNA-adenine methylase